jgi:hypothetical protein
MATDKARATGEQRSTPPVNRTYRLPLPPHPIAAEQARILVRLALSAWNITHAIDNALVIATELAANAAKIGEVFHLTLSHQNGNVLIEVRDSSEASPERQRQSMDRVDGRGLLLIEGCSKDWGWRQEQTGGKTIWALVDDLDTDPAAQPTTARPAIRM